MLLKATVALALLVLTPTSSSQDFESVLVTNGCDLAKAGSYNKEIIFRGEKAAVGCQIVIPTETFKKKYSYCALSGVYQSSAGGHICKFGTHDSEGLKVSFWASNATCEFTCIKSDGP